MIVPPVFPCRSVYLFVPVSRSPFSPGSHQAHPQFPVYIRFTIHFADGTRQEFTPASSGSAVPAGWFGEDLSDRELRLVEWNNREREEISGVTAEFQRNLKEVRTVEIDCLDPATPGALLAVTGTPAEEQ